MTLNDIIKSLEARWFMSSMATGAMGIFSDLIAQTFKQSYLSYLSYALIAIALLIFIFSFILYILRIFWHYDVVKSDVKHPVSSNFFAGISISSSVLSTAFSNVLIPHEIIGSEIGSYIAFIFYGFGMLSGLFFLSMVTYNFIVSEEIEAIHAIGVWLLPPVGLFVSVFAGNFVSRFFPEIGQNILLFNLFIVGIAFVVYIFTMMMIFHRVRLHHLPIREMAPSFFIPLAPVGVSLIAFFSFQKFMILNPTLLTIGETIKTFLILYIPLIIGFGLFCGISSSLVILHYARHKGLPFTLGFWAFVFPVDALGIGVILSSNIPPYGFLKYISLLLWSISMIVWIYVSYRTVRGILDGSIFIRPKCIHK